MVARDSTPGAGFLIVGEIRKAHGIKGECFVSPATDDVAGIYSKGRSLLVGDSEGRPDESGLALTIAGAREFKGGLIVRFDGVRQRNAAELLRGRTLLIEQAAARPLAEGEYFLHDLAGLEVCTTEGDVVGRVVEIYEGGPGHMLGVDDGARELLIPLSQEIVREVDLKAGRIVIDAIPGLLDL
ncbi:MAG: 16S rRNA processing protein RimM [Gemmatimonadota bacterium]|nr:MAG: 16S rRNA processing protein RimM [Gemmatimonadota bacterium]